MNNILLVSHQLESLKDDIHDEFSEFMEMLDEWKLLEEVVQLQTLNEQIFCIGEGLTDMCINKSLSLDCIYKYYDNIYMCFEKAWASKNYSDEMEPQARKEMWELYIQLINNLEEALTKYFNLKKH